MAQMILESKLMKERELQWVVHARRSLPGLCMHHMHILLGSLLVALALSTTSSKRGDNMSEKDLYHLVMNLSEPDALFISSY